MGFFVLFCGRVFARQKYTNIMNQLRMFFTPFGDSFKDFLKLQDQFLRIAKLIA